MTAVYLEVGKHRVFACAYDWPGWCRSAKNEELALEALGLYASRYCLVASGAQLRFPAKAAQKFEVLDRLPGSATTDFGAPGAIAPSDGDPTDAKQRRRLLALMKSAWSVFDGVVAEAPPSLRKGPRGGGRDRDAMVAHVREAEVAYAAKLGIRPARGTASEAEAARGNVRSRILDVIGAVSLPTPSPQSTEPAWPPRYAARRIAWHVLDHAWEIQDKSGSDL